MKKDLKNDNSYYKATATPYDPFPRLEGDTKADVIVLGGGMTGLSAALDLAEAGYDVALVEAGSVGHGASGRNGGQICTGYSKSIEKTVGIEKARAAWDLVNAGPRLIAERVKKHGIDCDLTWGYLHCAERKSQLGDLADHAKEFARWGYSDTKMLDREEVRAKVGSDLYHGALWEGGAGHFHPLNYCIGIAQAAAKAGARIHENSEVVEIDTGARPSVRTQHGRVEADHMILAGNAYLRDRQPKLYRKLMPVGSYIIATEPLDEDTARRLIRDNEAVADANFVVDYYRLSGDRRLLFGGRATYSGIEPRDVAGFVRPRMARVFPELRNIRIDYAWGGFIGITVDRMLHAGRLGPSTLFVQGYCGQGVALGNMCGRVMADAVRGQAEKFDVLAEFKHPIFPGGPLRAPVLSLGMLWYRLRDALA